MKAHLNTRDPIPAKVELVVTAKAKLVGIIPPKGIKSDAFETMGRRQIDRFNKAPA